MKREMAFLERPLQFCVRMCFECVRVWRVSLHGRVCAEREREIASREEQERQSESGECVCVYARRRYTQPRECRQREIWQAGRVYGRGLQRVSHILKDESARDARKFGEKTVKLFELLNTP